MIREKNIQLIQKNNFIKNRILEFKKKIYEHYGKIQICNPCEGN